eukprot:340409-Rhodomonas_salina.2
MLRRLHCGPLAPYAISQYRTLWQHSEQLRTLSQYIGQPRSLMRYVSTGLVRAPPDGWPQEQEQEQEEVEQTRLFNRPSRQLPLMHALCPLSHTAIPPGRMGCGRGEPRRGERVEVRRQSRDGEGKRSGQERDENRDFEKVGERVEVGRDSEEEEVGWEGRTAPTPEESLREGSGIRGARREAFCLHSEQADAEYCVGLSCFSTTTRVAVAASRPG